MTLFSRFILFECSIKIEWLKNVDEPIVAEICNHKPPQMLNQQIYSLTMETSCMSTVCLDMKYQNWKKGNKLKNKQKTKFP